VCVSGCDACILCARVCAHVCVCVCVCVCVRCVCRGWALWTGLVALGCTGVPWCVCLPPRRTSLTRPALLPPLLPCLNARIVYHVLRSAGDSDVGEGSVTNRWASPLHQFVCMASNALCTRASDAGIAAKAVHGDSGAGASAVALCAAAERGAVRVAHLVHLASADGATESCAVSACPSPLDVLARPLTHAWKALVDAVVRATSLPARTGRGSGGGYGDGGDGGRTRTLHPRVDISVVHSVALLSSAAQSLCAALCACNTGRDSTAALDGVRTARPRPQQPTAVKLTTLLADGCHSLSQVVMRLCGASAAGTAPQATPPPGLVSSVVQLWCAAVEVCDAQGVPVQVQVQVEVPTSAVGGATHPPAVVAALTAARALRPFHTSVVLGASGSANGGHDGVTKRGPGDCASAPPGVGQVGVPAAWGVGDDAVVARLWDMVTRFDVCRTAGAIGDRSNSLCSESRVPVSQRYTGHAATLWSRCSDPILRHALSTDMANLLRQRSHAGAVEGACGASLVSHELSAPVARAVFASRFRTTIAPLHAAAVAGAAWLLLPPTFPPSCKAPLHTHVRTHAHGGDALLAPSVGRGHFVARPGRGRCVPTTGRNWLLSTRVRSHMRCAAHARDECPPTTPTATAHRDSSAPVRSRDGRRRPFVSASARLDMLRVVEYLPSHPPPSGPRSAETMSMSASGPAKRGSIPVMPRTCPRAGADDVVAVLRGLSRRARENLQLHGYSSPHTHAWTSWYSQLHSAAASTTATTATSSSAAPPESYDAVLPPAHNSALLFLVLLADAGGVVAGACTSLHPHLHPQSHVSSAAASPVAESSVLAARHRLNTITQRHPQWERHGGFTAALAAVVPALMPCMVAADDGTPPAPSSVPTPRTTTAAAETTTSPASMGVPPCALLAVHMLVGAVLAMGVMGRGTQCRPTTASAPPTGDGARSGRVDAGAREVDATTSVARVGTGGAVVRSSVSVGVTTSAAFWRRLRRQLGHMARSTGSSAWIRCAHDQDHVRHVDHLDHLDRLDLDQDGGGAKGSDNGGQCASSAPIGGGPRPLVGGSWNDVLLQLLQGGTAPSRPRTAPTPPPPAPAACAAGTAQSTCPHAATTAPGRRMQIAAVAEGWASLLLHPLIAVELLAPAEWVDVLGAGGPAPCVDVVRAHTAFVVAGRRDLRSREHDGTDGEGGGSGGRSGRSGRSGSDGGVLGVGAGGGGGAAGWLGTTPDAPEPDTQWVAHVQDLFWSAVVSRLSWQQMHRLVELLSGATFPNWFAVTRFMQSAQSGPPRSWSTWRIVVERCIGRTELPLPTVSTASRTLFVPWPDTPLPAGETPSDVVLRAMQVMLLHDHDI